MAIKSNAEKRADLIREVEGFQNFSLIGIREDVEQMLNTIGRVNGIFSTYALHDISHIDAMLKMLEWIIPPQTKDNMTTADWLLIVLSIYFHDMGMVVAKEEFENRADNKSFMDWFDLLDTTTEGRQYKSRTKRMSSDDEKNQFFFQEYIRMGHASRIAEFITGRTSTKWGSEVKPIVESINKLLINLPARFKENLAIVCESHHKDNLNDLDKYPIFEQCGSDIHQGIINVQYAAILLRTVDLLHVTKDRTPSIMYKIIGLTDPKGVEEWDKQLGTFAVRCKAREFDPNNPDSTIIIVCADFTKEEPLFALQQYISYADGQIQQSKSWVLDSQKKPDGKNYLFPWTHVSGDVRLEGEKPCPLRFELDRGKLLNLLVGHTIYNDATVAVRELLQNGIDAVRYQRYIDERHAKVTGQKPPAIGKVTVHWDPKESILVIEDNGIGMNRDVIENHLMKVGSSYYQTAKFKDDEKDFNPISRFGIGILTCFMISEDFEIITCYDNTAHRIRLTTVDVDYLLRELPVNSPKSAGISPHGTKVILRIRDTVDLTKKSIEEIIRYWIIMPACKIEFIELEKEPKLIGFNSCEEVLRYYHENAEKGEKGLKNKKNVKREYRIKNKIMQNLENPGLPVAVYELGTCVEKIFAPEFMFTSKPQEDMPCVCIEGIRVADCLPGFDRYSAHPHFKSISGILSVRNDPNFKTTVARQGLEIDDKYEQVSILCGEMLYEHILDEIDRISKGAGNPYSIASTASKWLYDYLMGACKLNKTRQHLIGIHSKSPSMVIEKISNSTGDKRRIDRNMISEETLKEEDHFWSIESRLIDSLGTISRDLGIELSYNEFLNTLAPNYNKSQYLPLLPDAHIFGKIFRKSHYAILAKCSKGEQQSVVKWVRYKQDESSRIAVLENIISSDKYLEYYKERRFSSIESIFAEICDIDADFGELDMIQTRIASIIRKNSELDHIYSALFSGINKIVCQDWSVKRLGLLVEFLGILLSVERRGYPNEELISRYDFWSRNHNEVLNILKYYKIECNLPYDIKEYTEKLRRFNATEYWCDWWFRRQDGV